MGFNTSSSTITLTAKLTPFGRQQLASNNNSLITSFSLGDSDANYYSVNSLSSGQVPAEAGEIGPNNTFSNSTTQTSVIKSALVFNNGLLKKPVSSQSSIINSEIALNGQITISGANITQNLINRNNYATDSLTNLFYSFGLPLNSIQDNIYTGITYSNGGFSDTALSGLANNTILVFGVDNSTYGESLDGKSIKIVLPTSAGTYTIYSTFQSKGASKNVEDSNYRDTSTVTGNIGSDISFLFSDTIKTPNGGSLSWGTGFGTIKPFSVNNKQLYNLQTNSNVGLSADTIVGVGYLDKGFLVITHPTIISNYTTSLSTGVTITFNSISTSVTQNITCIADRGEFGTSTNPTFSGNDVPRISEVGLYDINGNLIALAKTDRHITKNINEFKAIGIKISI